MKWFRVDADIAAHHKMIDLAEALEIDVVRAIGHVICLYGAVAQYHDDGDVSCASAQTLATWSDWIGEPYHFLEHLNKCGIIDELDDGNRLIIHGWDERNGHLRREIERKSKHDWRLAKQGVARQRRDKGANMARQRRAPTSTSTSTTTDPNGSVVAIISDASHPHSASPSAPQQSPNPEESGELPTAAAPSKPTDPARELADRWNALAAELALPQIEKLTAARRPRAKARAAEGLLERWDEFAAALRASAWHCGANDREWRANFDWLVTPGKWLKLVEGANAGRASVRPPTTRAEKLQAQIDSVPWADEQPGYTGPETP